MTPLPSPSQSSYTSTSATKKLGTSITPSITKNIFQLKLHDDEEKITKAKIPDGNLIINSVVLQKILDVVSVCSFCKNGNLVIYETGRASCATKLVLKCNLCDNSRHFWSVSGHFGSTKSK